MFNLKEGGGTFKGLIGECMFKLTNQNVVITKFFNKNKYIEIFSRYLSSEQLSFICNNWYSLDAIEIIFVNGKHQVVLYEIKTRNKYPRDLGFKPKMTLETHILYNQAKIIGFVVKLATIWLCDNWNYDICINNFDEQFYCIDKPKRYDKTRVASDMKKK